MTMMSLWLSQSSSKAYTIYIVRHLWFLQLDALDAEDVFKLLSISFISITVDLEPL